MNKLPAHWVDRLFAKLHGIYGTTFTSKYVTGADSRGIDSGLENAKETWAEDLAGFHDMPESIAYALKKVNPVLPPSSRQFVALCRSAPRPTPIALPPPEMSRDQIEANQAKLKNAFDRNYGYDFRKWARDHRDAFLRGDDLYIAQIRNASEALGEIWETDSVTRKRVCRPAVNAR